MDAALSHALVDETELVHACARGERWAQKSLYENYFHQLLPICNRFYAIEGFSHREIGEQLGITESTSRSNLVKARQKLKAALVAHKR